MLSPYEIRELRKRYGLTQKELSLLLGWGSVTMSRYENGALQDVATGNSDWVISTVQERRKAAGEVSHSDRRICSD